MTTTKSGEPDGDHSGLPEVAEAAWLGEHFKTALSKTGATAAQLAFGAEQRTRRHEFLRSAAGQAFVELLDQRDALLGDIAWQMKHPLPSVLDQRATMAKLTALLGEVETHIAADEHTSTAAAGLPVDGSSASVIVHTLNRRRRHVLDPVIDRALELTSDPTDRAAAWNSFVALALAVPPIPPLLGFAHGTVRYAGGTISKSAFCQRLSRRARSGRQAP